MTVAWLKHFTKGTNLKCGNTTTVNLYHENHRHHQHHPMRRARGGGLGYFMSTTEVSKKIAAEIMKDLRGRSGCLDGVDRDIQEEMENDFSRIIKGELVLAASEQPKDKQ